MYDLIASIDDPLKSEGRDEESQFWTQGRADRNSNGSHRWCDLDRPFSMYESYWDAGQPNASTGDCVLVNTQNKSAALGVENCTATRRFVCEVRNFHILYVHSSYFNVCTFCY
jgi:hypothetical protein